jgi:AraC family transcriptional regulator, regulatory protein of adaptative response / methylated-DNA-[protein]-cysteine methyltransferase
MTVTVRRDLIETLARTCASLPSATHTSRETLALTCVESPVGPLILGTQAEAIAVLEFCDESGLQTQVSALQARFACPMHAGEAQVLGVLIEELSAYFARRLRRFDVPLFYRGSSFQERVWSELLRIPYGETCSYGTIAQRLETAAPCVRSVRRIT